MENGHKTVTISLPKKMVEEMKVLEISPSRFFQKAWANKEEQKVNGLKKDKMIALSFVAIAKALGPEFETMAATWAKTYEVV
jgi:hypothetical protein